jgi:hypothetical protein
VLIIVMVIAFVPACSPGSELDGPTPGPNRSPRCVALTSAFDEAKAAWEQLREPKNGKEWDRMRTSQQQLFESGCLAS